MNRVRLLCQMNRHMMEQFSHNTVKRLKAHTLFRLTLPSFQSFLEINVGKEVEKDRRVIKQAASLHQSGAQPGVTHVEALLQESRRIDQDFLRQAALFPVDIRIQYQDIERYRQQRIEQLLHNSFRILAKWQGNPSYRATVQQLYSETEYQTLLHEILRLYAMETNMLSSSVRIPHLLSLARDKVTQTIIDTMLQEATSLAGSLTRKIYHR